MKLSKLYELTIEIGMRNDPRGYNVVKNILKKEKEKYQKLTEKEKKDYDIEKLRNPYPDTRILYHDKDPEIKSILVGIDIETPEILLADSLRKSGKRIDLVISHHPEGRAYATFYEVMNMQVDILHKLGVPINIAESITEPRIKEVCRKVLPRNHTRAVDAARLLDIPFMCIHTVSDNLVSSYLQKLFNKRKAETLGEIMDILEEIPEYNNAKKNSIGPTIISGSKDRKSGKIFVDMTGGTEGSTEALEKLSNAGVGTIISMHMSEDHFKNAEKYHLNVIIAGHIPSDTLGLNLLLDAIEKKAGKLEIIPCSGFIRIRR